MSDCQFRFAVAGDEELILSFIRALAEYEQMSDQVQATPELIGKWIIQRQMAQVIFAVADGKEVGFALYFTNFSTFLGRPGVYLEDLFVLPEARGRGYGKKLLQELARIAVGSGYGRLEWACLDWNQPSIDFYTKRMGASPMDEWTIYRLSGESLFNAAPAVGADHPIF